MTEKKETEATPDSSHRLRLPVRTEAPPKKVLDEMMSECQRNPSRLIELPIEIPGFAEGFRLTVERELGGSRPIWNLYAGQGAANRTLWTYTLTDTDMICEVLSLSVSSPPPPAPDVPVAAQPPAASAQPAAASGWPPDVLKPSDQSIWKEGAPPAAKAPVSASTPAAKPASAVDELKPIDSMPLIDKAGPNILLGQIMVDSGLLPEPVLDAALSLQEMVRQGTLTSEDATDALRRMHKHGLSLQDAIDAVKKKKQEKPPADAVDLLRKSGIVSDEDISKARTVVEQLRKAGLEGEKSAETGTILLDLIRLAGFITDEDIKRASTASSSRPTDVLKTLLSSGAIDSLSFEVASRFVKHIRVGTFKQEQAIIALHYSQRMRTNFEDTVHSLGWKVPIES